MELNNIRKIGVCGAGTMGQGIAQICAMAGYEAILYDINAEMLSVAKKNITKNLDKGIEKGKVTDAQKTAALGNLRFTEKLEDVVADVVVEAVLEKLEIKLMAFLGENDQ